MDHEGLNFNNGLKPFANGGVVFGPDTELIGEGLITTKDNSEVSEPLEKLKRLLEEEIGNKKNMEGVTLPIRLLSTEQACVFLGIGITQIKNLVKNKKITKGRQGRSTVFDVDELRKYKESLSN